ncbi:MAG: flagellar basal body L-ring protein FlgH [Moraxellaceae bacterium]|nr:MAG: flagellar basal body L-ring protein FlgH [Moraxellaceae bacterium]
MKIIKIASMLSVLCILLSLGACAGLQDATMNDPLYAPKYPHIKTPKPDSAGSLFSSNGYQPLFNDTVAKRVGDIINVRLNESTVSKKSASTNIKKDTSNKMNGSIVLGKEILGLGNAAGEITNLGSEGEFTGSAGSDQSNSLQGNIAVTIAEVLPNGSFVVRGEKWMKLNQGDEYIRITGMIRPVDIDATNTIDSTKIANARITYGGRGAVADSNRIGWLARFFNSPKFGY